MLAENFAGKIASPYTMEIKNLLASVSRDAIEHITQNVNLRNEIEYQKLKKLFDGQCFDAKNFDDSELDVLDFDWQSIERDRNWWWQLQALPFLNWYVHSLGLQSEEEKAHYFSLCLGAICCWADNAKENIKSPLAWHDHAAAFRLRNLSHWLLICHAEGLPIAVEIRADRLATLIAEHLDWLQEEKNYSRHTNHGFDQVMIVLTVGLMFHCDDFEAHRQSSRERLKAEIAFAFTEEGVHKENSPTYQKYMLGRLKQLRDLAPLGETEISQMGERYIENAEAFLRAVTLPNGYLPMIGDTSGADEGLLYERKERVDVLDYSASGYVIVRGIDGSDKEFFVLLKNTHESNYHRHDDDMMIYIYYDGEVVLGDGGLYKYQEKDLVRKHLRSYWAHSVPFIDEVAIRDKNKLPEKPRVIREGDCMFRLESMMFGVRLVREVSICFAESLRVFIADKNFSNRERLVWANFAFEDDFPLSISKCSISVIFEKFLMSIKCDVGFDFSLRKGWRGDGGCSSGIVSKEYGVVEAATNISVLSRAVCLSFLMK